MATYRSMKPGSARYRAFQSSADDAGMCGLARFVALGMCVCVHVHRMGGRAGGREAMTCPQHHPLPLAKICLPAATHTHASAHACTHEHALHSPSVPLARHLDAHSRPAPACHEPQPHCSPLRVGRYPLRGPYSCPMWAHRRDMWIRRRLQGDRVVRWRSD